MPCGVLFKRRELICMPSGVGSMKINRERGALAWEARGSRACKKGACKDSWWRLPTSFASQKSGYSDKSDISTKASHPAYTVTKLHPYQCTIQMRPFARPAGPRPRRQCLPQKSIASPRPSQLNDGGDTIFGYSGCDPVHVYLGVRAIKLSAELQFLSSGIEDCAVGHERERFIRFLYYLPHFT